MMRRWPLMLSMVLIVGGCTSDDPGEGGFFGGLMGLGSGAYERRLADQTEAWKTEEARYQEEVATKTELDGTLRERRDLAIDLEREVAGLEAEVDSLNTEIQALRQEATVTSRDVAEAEASVASLLDDIDKLRAEQEVQAQARALGADGDSETDPATFGEPQQDQVSELRAYIIRLQEAVDGLKKVRDSHADKTLTPTSSGID